jgi:hypothetical protein
MFVGIYTFVLLFAAKRTGASVDARTVMPIVVPLVVGVARLVDRAWSSIRLSPAIRHRIVGAVLLVAGSSAVALSTASAVATAVDQGRQARGYADHHTMSSPLAMAVRQVPAGALVVTNRPWALYEASGHQPIVPAPAPLYPSVSLVPISRAALVQRTCAGPAYLAWYRVGPSPRRPALGAGVSMRPLAVARDGKLYRLVPAAGECAVGARSISQLSPKR